MKLGNVFILVCAFFCLWVTAANATVRINYIWHPNSTPPDYGYYSIDPVTISGSTTWTAAAGPYIIENTVAVAEGATLSIEAGTVVQVNDAVGIYVYGTLNAHGTNFTRNQGDYWRGIYLAPTAGASVLDGSSISYAGYYHGSGLIDFKYTAIYADSCSPQITNCSFSNSESNGILLKSSHATVTGNSFSNMGSVAEPYYPILYSTLDTFPAISGNTTSGSGYNGIGLPGGTFTVSGTWQLPGTGFPYLMNGPLTVNTDATLTVAPGNTIKSDGNGIYVNGTLTANGSAPLPIAFTTRNASPGPGNWLGIYLSPTAGGSSLSHVNISYAGYAHGGGLFDFHYASLFVDGSSPQLSYVSITNSEWHGLELRNASPVIDNNQFANNGGSGLYSSGNSRPAITNSSFTANGSAGNYVVSLDATSVPNPTGVTFTGNSYQGIQVRGGSIGSSATWKNWSANAPYAVTGNVYVDAGQILTIEPTTTVKLWFTGFYVNGTLSANSTSGRITFTSLADDSIGGDTNGDALSPTPTNPAPGNWLGIYLAPTAGGSFFNNCDFIYSGYSHGGGLIDFKYTTIYADSCSPQITNCSFSNSESNGILLKSSHATVTGNSFSNMGIVDIPNYPILYSTLDTFPTISGNMTSGIGYNGIGLPGGTFTASGTWNLPGTNFPYLMNGALTVDTGVTLTVAPGNTVKSDGNGIYVNGTLTANGTTPLPITFTTRSASPGPGSWLGIYLSPTAGASALSHVSIFYAGYAHSGGLIDFHYASLFVDGISPPLSYLSISNSEGHGLELRNASPAIGNSQFANSGGSGLYSSGNSRPAITNSSFSANGSAGNYVVSLDATSVPNPTGVTFSGNSYQGIQVRGGSIGSSATWKNWSANTPYAVTGDVTVDAGQTLTIEPVTTIKLWFTGFYVYGTLSANSTTGRITFTSLADDSIGGDTNGNGAPVPTDLETGNWKGIYLASTAGGSVFNKCDFAYSGYYHGGGLIDFKYTTIYADSCSPQITNCAFSNSESNGILLRSSNAIITGNSFSNMGSVAEPYYPILYSTLDTFPAISGNTTSGSGYNGIGLPGGTFTVSGTWQLPGTGFPYLMNGPLSVNTGVTLNMAPGNTVKSNFDGIYVNGTLTAVGTAPLPITFTTRNASPGPGNWLGIYLSPTAGGSALSHVNISYAGYWHGGGLTDFHYTSLFVDGSSPQLANISISNSEWNCLELRSASPVITNSRFENCGGTQIAATVGSQPTVSTSRFIGTSPVWGITNDTPAQVINARNNYWGASSGPTHSSNPGGTGVKVSDGVDFSNFRTSEQFMLEVTITGTGSVYIMPGSLTYSSGKHTSPFDYPQLVTLSTAPAWYSAVAWSGCTAAGNDCSVTMDTDRSVTAAFSVNQNARLALHPSVPYGTIQSAYDATSSPTPVNDTIRARDVIFLEDLIFSQAVTVILEGGMNSDFNTSTGYSTVKGSMRISHGKIIVKKVKIHP